MGKAAKPVAARLGPLAPKFGQRVRTAAEMIGGPIAAAAAMDLSYDQVRKIMNETAVPSFPAIAGLARNSRCSFDWLAFNTGPQLRDKATEVAAVPEGHLANLDVVSVRRFDRVAAEASIFFSRRYLEDVLRCAPGDVAIGEIEGDSMEPTVGAGDFVMVDLQRRSLVDGKVFVFRIGEELVVKRVQLELDGALLLISDNKVYADRRLSQAEADRVDVIGRLIWSGGRV